MAFDNINAQLQNIAAKGNYPDLMNAMAFLKAYSSIYTTGQSPTLRKLRGGREAASVANLEAILTGPTSSTNSMHDFNIVRAAFFSYVAVTNPDVYAAMDTGLYSRFGVTLTPGFPVDVEDCTGTVLANVANLTDYLRTWNEAKVIADFAACGIRTPYLFDTGVDGFLIESSIQPDNDVIPYNAPAVQRHAQRENFNVERGRIVDEEAQEKPKSIATYSADNI